MDTNEHKLLLKKEVFQVVGCAMEVLNTLGHGLLEKPYENALVVEFGLNGIPFKQQPRFNVIYKSVRVSEYFPDLIVFDRIVTAAGTSFAGRSSAKANFRAWKAASPSPGSRASLRISSGCSSATL